MDKFPLSLLFCRLSSPSSQPLLPAAMLQPLSLSMALNPQRTAKVQPVTFPPCLNAWPLAENITQGRRLQLGATPFLTAPKNDPPTLSAEARGHAHAGTRCRSEALPPLCPSPRAAAPRVGARRHSLLPTARPVPAACWPPASPAPCAPGPKPAPSSPPGTSLPAPRTLSQRPALLCLPPVSMDVSPNPTTSGPGRAQ